MNPKASILQLGSCSRRQCWQHFNLLRSIINSKDLNYHRHVIIDTHQLIESQQFVLFIRLYFLAFSLDNTPYKDSVNHVLRHAISERRVLLTVFGPKVSPAQKSVGAPRGALVMVYIAYFLARLHLGYSSCSSFAAERGKVAKRFDYTFTLSLSVTIKHKCCLCLHCANAVDTLQDCGGE